METLELEGSKFEYEVIGSGEPLLLIAPVLADGFLPLVRTEALARGYRLIRYHKRGWAGSTHSPAPVTIADHAADAARLLRRLGVRRAHVAGHSSGGSIALELAIGHPEMVHTLCLLEPTLLSVPSADAFFAKARPAFEAYEGGRHEAALGIFMSVVSGLDWETCRALLDDRMPDCVSRTVKDANTFFGIELPSLMAWRFGPEQAARVRQPTLSIVGTETEPLWVEIADRLRAWLPKVEERKIDDVGHLLHIQRAEPVAEGIAAFLAENAIPAEARSL